LARALRASLKTTVVAKTNSLTTQNEMKNIKVEIRTHAKKRGEILNALFVGNKNT
jgi:hypothetical protein